MKNRKTLFIAIAVACLVIAITLISRQPQKVSAQDQLPPPVHDRVSFGMVGITSGQTVRVSVANTIMPNDVNLPPGPTRVVMSFRLLNGEFVRDGRGNVVRRQVDLGRGDSAFLDLDYADLPPGPTRIQIRPVVIVQLPPPVPDTNTIPGGSVVPTVEVINNANGRTQFAMFTSPAVIRGFNPQPDPPSGE